MPDSNVKIYLLSSFLGFFWGGRVQNDLLFLESFLKRLPVSYIHAGMHFTDFGFSLSKTTIALLILSTIVVMASIIAGILYGINRDDIGLDKGRYGSRELLSMNPWMAFTGTKGPVHTGRVSRFACKFACKPFDAACNLCEHSH